MRLTCEGLYLLGVRSLAVYVDRKAVRGPFLDIVHKVEQLAQSFRPGQLADEIRAYSMAGIPGKKTSDADKR